MIEIYRSSRIETLADLLAQHLVDARPAAVLAPATILVGHLGMKRWLTTHLASRPPVRKAGARPHPRIAANLDLVLPSEWLDRLAQRHLGAHGIAIEPYRRKALRWRIFEVLARLDAPEVARYLDGEDAERRRFQLADRLAGLYAQYLVYRRDWLAAWESGSAAAPAHWQGALWRQLVAAIALPHRGRRMAELMRRLAQLPADPDEPALHVFGLSHLPPDALLALDALSATRRVCIYFPDPCRELWEELASRREALAADLDGGRYLEAIGHPLLATLGRLGQHYSLLLRRRDAACDLTDLYDEDAPPGLPADAPLLARVQHSLRTLQPMAAARPDGAPGDPRLDASLRVHVCHTRLRELEVLKDALLDRLAADPTLQPREIVVMAPNMALYAPLLPTVFGEPGERGSLLPWQMADVTLLRTHPLLGAVRELLDLPAQRITRSQVLALLALPAVQRRFGLDESRLAALERWLARSHVAWGLDGAMKAEFGAAAVDEHSFAFGLDRMAMGYLTGGSEEQTIDDILPATPVTGPEAEAFGALWGLLAALREGRAGLTAVRPLSAWASALQRWFERLFEADRADEDEAAALAVIARLTAQLGEETVAAGIDPEVSWPVLREALVQALDGVPERQRFLAGGITFCGMVPQRSIPFRCVALIGLNDGDYPRARSDGGLDLMQAHPRLGDRDGRQEDRYLFLEALMSARETLHLSYVGEDAREGSARNPAQPLAELLAFLDLVHGLAGADDEGQRHWRVRHPLQPFDGRYFELADPECALRAYPGHKGDGADPRLYSYSAAYAAVRADASAREQPFLAGVEDTLPAHADGPVALADLCAFLREPSRWWCQRVLGLSRAALEADETGDAEPLDTGRDARDPITVDLVRAALASGAPAIPSDPPPRYARSGRYPGGALGAEGWQSLRAEATEWLAAARTLPPFRQGAATAQTLAVDLSLGEQRVVGDVGPVYRHDGRLWLVAISTAADGFQQRLPLYAQWAALRLAHPDADAAVRLLCSRDKAVLIGPEPAFPDDPALLEAGLRELIALYRDAHATVGHYFPRSSHAYASSGGDLSGAVQAWSGGWRRGERDHGQGYHALLGGDGSFLVPGTAAHARFAAIALRLQAILAPATREAP
jgi:exodeoxyribonuclease V gamma subunit